MPSSEKRLIDFEKYIPAKEELRRFKKENEGDALFSKGGFLYRLVPFAE
ncbi:MAG: hypothetical protein AABY39_08995 [Nitrospirota bacterium]